MLRPAILRAAILRAAMIGAAIAALLVLAGCGSDSGRDGAMMGDSGVARDLQAHDWALDQGDSSLTATGGRRPTIAFGAESASGEAPCNAFTAQVSVDGDSIQLSNIAATRMLCGGDADAAEAQYLAALGNVRTVATHTDDALVLTGPSNLRLSYSAFDASDAIVGSWHVVSIADGNGAVVSVLPGTDPVLTFEDGGNLGVTAGCNTIGGDWALDGDEMTIDKIRSTMMACDSPPGVMEQESALTLALGETRAAQVSPDTLMLRDDDGSILVIATAQP